MLHKDYCLYSKQESSVGNHERRTDRGVTCHCQSGEGKEGSPVLTGERGYCPDQGTPSHLPLPKRDLGP